MLKKVLSVVLALVLALGVCAIAASAATASQLEDILSHLPNERNAHYYKDATEANILAAREAAYAALESGKTADINAAYALCQAAYDEAWASEEVEFDEWGSTVAVFYNRDESKAHATLYYDTDAPDYLMPGDTFDVTFSIKTDFPIRQFRVAFAYDRTIFQANETPETAGSSISYPDGIEKWYDTKLFPLNTAYGYRPDNGAFITTRQFYPVEWDKDMISKYYFIDKEFSRSTDYDADYMIAEEKTEIFTVSMKVRDDAPIGSTGEIFVCPEMIANMQNDYLFDGVSSMPIKIFRGFSTDPYEYLADIDNMILRAYSIHDEGAGVGQTITWEGTALKTYTVGEEPVVELDYDALEAAVDEAAGYEAAKYTEDSWKTYEDAVAAGTTELTDKALETQDDIDALTKTITDARDALVLAPEEPPVEEPCEILNITENTVPVVGKYTELEVLVNKPVKKIQFIDVNGNTFTYYEGYSRTLDIKDNEDGTQTWTVNLMSRAAEETYEARVKNANSAWSDKTYTYNATVQVSDNTIFSAEVPDAYDGRLKYGAHNIVVKTSTDVTKLQVIYNGTTTTLTPTSSKATVEEVDDQLVWTIKQNFFKVGNGMVYQFASRSATSAWVTSEDVTLTVDVLH